MSLAAVAELHGHGLRVQNYYCKYHNKINTYLHITYVCVCICICNTHERSSVKEHCKKLWERRRNLHGAETSLGKRTAR